MTSVGALQAQLNIARAAREQNKISQADYVKFVSNQNRLIAEARAREAKPSPVPHSPTDVVMQNSTGTWVRGDYEVTNRVTVGDKTTVTIEPKNKSVEQLYDERQFAPKTTGSLFGMSTAVYVNGKIVDVDPALFKASPEAQQRELTIIKQGVAKEAALPYSQRSLSVAENKAILGLTLATTTAVGIGKPVLGAMTVTGVGVAEGAKRAVTGKDLTVEEAINVASLSQIGGATALAVRGAVVNPRVQRAIDTSYMQSMKETGMWKATSTEKLMMKVTGVRPNSLAPEIVTAKSSPTAPVSFKDLQQGGLAEDYFWSGKPSPKTSELWVAEQGTKANKIQEWAKTTLVNRKKVYLEGLFEREVYPTGTRLLSEIMEPDFEAPYNPQMGTPFIPNLPRMVTPKAINIFKPFGLPVVTGKRSSASYVNSLTIIAPQIKTAAPIQKVKQTQTYQARLRQKSALTQSFDQIVGQEQAQTQIVSPIAIQRIQQNQIVTQRTRQTFTTPFPPAMPRAKSISRYLPNLSTGGGDSFGRGFGGLSGKWAKKNNPVKPWDAMARTFGLKVSKKSARKVNALDKSLERFGNSFSLTNQRRRKRKR